MGLWEGAGRPSCVHARLIKWWERDVQWWLELLLNLNSHLFYLFYEAVKAVHGHWLDQGGVWVACSRSVEAQWPPYVKLIIIFQLKIGMTLLLSMNKAIINLITVVLILFLALFYLIEALKGFVYCEKALFLCSTVVLYHLIHLLISNYKQNFNLTKLWNLNSFFYQSLLSLAFQVYSLQFIVNYLHLLGLFLHSFVTDVHHLFPATFRFIK